MSSDYRYGRHRRTSTPRLSHQKVAGVRVRGNY